MGLIDWLIDWFIIHWFIDWWIVFDWLIDSFIHNSLIFWLMDSFQSYAKHRIYSSFKKDIWIFGLIVWLIDSSILSFIDLLIDSFQSYFRTSNRFTPFKKVFDFCDCLIVGLIDWLCWLTLNKRFIITNLILFNIFCLGHESKAMLNNGGPRYKRSKLERQINSEVLYCVFILFGLCLIGAVG